MCEMCFVVREDCDILAEVSNDTYSNTYIVALLTFYPLSIDNSR